jgi:hypothetical protein
VLGRVPQEDPGQPDETLISDVCADSSPGGPVRFLVPAAAAANFEGNFPPDHPGPPLAQATQRTAAM